MPTKKNRERKGLQKETCELIRVLIKNSNKAQQNSGNLVSLLMSEEGSLGWEEVVDDCRNFYMAGKETTANAITWALLLLGLHQEWQNKARHEVLRVFGYDNPLTPETTSDLKIVSLGCLTSIMFLSEIAIVTLGLIC